MILQVTCWTLPTLFLNFRLLKKQKRKLRHLELVIVQLPNIHPFYFSQLLTSLILILCINIHSHGLWTSTLHPSMTGKQMDIDRHFVRQGFMQKYSSVIIPIYKILYIQDQQKFFVNHFLYELTNVWVLSISTSNYYQKVFS